MAKYYVHIMTNRSGTLYTGVTRNLERRVYEHKHKLLPGFTSRYNIDRLVYYEVTSDIRAAIAREKQVKAWTRAKRVALVESVNRDWKDLSESGFSRTPVPATHNVQHHSEIPRSPRRPRNDISKKEAAAPCHTEPTASQRDSSSRKRASE